MKSYWDLLGVAHAMALSMGMAFYSSSMSKEQKELHANYNVDKEIMDQR